MVTDQELQQFIQTIWDYFHANRRDFPWRNTTDPYKILVSEVMLQQTQTYRVEPKFTAFIERFPDFKTLGDAELPQVFEYWSGLGYNRRAKFLRDAARIVSTNYHGELPHTIDEVDALPGIGYATACAILTFSYNYHLPFIETNIRRVYLHFFYPEQDEVNDKEIFELVSRSIDETNPREWYYALMDYGAYLPKTGTNANVRSAHYTKQTQFEGSVRQIRGEIMRILLKEKAIERVLLIERLEPTGLFDQPTGELTRTTQALDGLIKDGIATEENGLVQLL